MGCKHVNPRLWIKCGLYIPDLSMIFFTWLFMVAFDSLSKILKTDAYSHFPGHHLIDFLNLVDIYRARLYLAAA
jgi:hypothetical protein